jgi:P27 family predicted phage terminase small subunit
MATGRPNGRPRTQKGAGSAVSAPLNKDAAAVIPPFPEGLNEDGENLWMKIWAGAKDWLHESDAFIVTELCQIYQDKELYRRALDLGSVPRTYRLSNKTIVPHPYVALLKDSRAQMNTHLSSLGLSPADRARIGAIEALKDDPVLDLLRRKIKRTTERLNLVEEIDDWDEDDYSEEESEDGQ